MSGENVIAVSFAENGAAYEAFTNLKELDSQGQVSVGDAAIVERDENGQLSIKDQVEDRHLAGTATGGLVGLVVGILGGPFGVLIGGATGLLIGSLFDVDDAADEGSVLAELSNTVRPGQTVVLAALSEPSEDVVDRAMARLDGHVLRRSVDDVEAEIAAAEDAERAAAHEARKKLHAERRSQLKQEIHERVEALKERQREIHARQKEKLEALTARM